jgi:hypothetical protein
LIEQTLNAKEGTMPDRNTILSWIITAITRGLTWYLAVHIGIQATQAASIADGVIQGLIGTGLALATLWHSVHERTDLVTAQSQSSQPPKPGA